MDEAENRKPLTLKQAAGIAGVSSDTVARWCKRFGIAKQLHLKMPWRVNIEAREIVTAGRADALARYKGNLLKQKNSGPLEARSGNHLQKGRPTSISVFAIGTLR